jgi:uncharacterized iron-regulated protein
MPDFSQAYWVVFTCVPRLFIIIAFLLWLQVLVGVGVGAGLSATCDLWWAVEQGVDCPSRINTHQDSTLIDLNERHFRHHVAQTAYASSLVGFRNSNTDVPR